MPPGPSPALFFDTLNAYQRGAALKAAIELKLFTTIAQGSQTPPELAAKCGIAERGARILADYLTAAGFLTKQSGRYGLTADSAMFLDERSPAYAGGAVEFLAAPKLHANFADLTNRIRAGGAPPEDQSIITTGHEVWERFARGMAPLTAMLADNLAKQILAGSSEPMRVLDIAASHGLFGIAFARQNPQARIIAQDWDNVLNVARENAARFGVAGRFETLPGNVMEVPLGTGYDIVLLTNILHHFNAADCERMLKKVHACLKPQGRAVIVEFVPNDDRVSPPTAAMFSLVMLASTPAGDAYTLGELKKLLAAAGFVNPATNEMGMQQVVVAHKA